MSISAGEVQNIRAKFPAVWDGLGPKAFELELNGPSGWTWIQSVRELQAITAAVLALQSSGGGTGTSSTSHPLTATLGQTVFTLPSSANSSLVLFVNAMGYVAPVDITISGNTLTWLNNSFTLSPSDIINAYY